MGPMKWRSSARNERAAAKSPLARAAAYCWTTSTGLDMSVCLRFDLGGWFFDPATLCTRRAGGNRQAAWILVRRASRRAGESWRRPGKGPAPRRGLRSTHGGPGQGRSVGPPRFSLRSLGTFADPDGLSQLLLRLSVTSSLYCLSQMSAPWGFEVGARPMPAFHLLISGSACLEVDGGR